MIPNNLLNLIITSILSLSVISCGLTLERQQGNIITEVSKKIDIGATQSEVVKLLGLPLLKHPLNDKIWIYAYQRNTSNETINQHLIVTFNNKDIVTNIKKYNLDKTAVGTLIN